MITAKQEKFAQCIADGMTQADARFYVYALVDPRDNQTFYIGKGTGDRLNHHEQEVRAGRVTNGAKFRRIKEIHGNGLSVLAFIIKNGMTEKNALRMERKLINRHANTLCNISMGSRSSEETVAEECRLILNKWGDDVANWLSGWHPDCIKGFGGVFEAACFYFKTRAWMQDRVKGT